MLYIVNKYTFFFLPLKFNRTLFLFVDVNIKGIEFYYNMNMQMMYAKMPTQATSRIEDKKVSMLRLADLN